MIFSQSYAKVSDYRAVQLSHCRTIDTHPNNNSLFFDLGKVQKIEFYNFQVFLLWFYIFFMVYLSFVVPCNKYLSQVIYHVVIIVNVLQQYGETCWNVKENNPCGESGSCSWTLWLPCACWCVHYVFWIIREKGR